VLFRSGGHHEEHRDRGPPRLRQAQRLAARCATRMRPAVCRGRIVTVLAGLHARHTSRCGEPAAAGPRALAELVGRPGDPVDIPRTWPDADLAWAVAHNVSMAGTIRALNLKVGGSVYLVLSQRIRELGLDTTHWKGQAWNRGRTYFNKGKARPLEEILVRDSDYLDTNRLKRRLIMAGTLTWQCAMCGGTTWQGQPIPLQLDHVNGDRRDNRLENLRVLCPNCHSLTDLVWSQPRTLSAMIFGLWCCNRAVEAVRWRNAPVLEWYTGPAQTRISVWIWGFDSPPGHTRDRARSQRLAGCRATWHRLMVPPRAPVRVGSPRAPAGTRCRCHAMAICSSG
jgi:hypothetical protein